jgi:hypothetical protein
MGRNCTEIFGGKSGGSGARETPVKLGGAMKYGGSVSRGAKNYSEQSFARGLLALKEFH